MVNPQQSTPTKGIEVAVGLMPLDLFVEWESTKGTMSTWRPHRKHHILGWPEDKGTQQRSPENMG